MISLFFINSSIAQEDAMKEIKDAITENFNKWLVKGEFETNAEYEKRIKNDSEETLKKITEEKVNVARKNHMEPNGVLLGEYNPEENIFQLSNNYSITVDRELAPTIKKKFGKENSFYNIYIKPINVEIIDNKWKTTEAFVIFLESHPNFIHYLQIDQSTGIPKLSKNNSEFELKPLEDIKDRIGDDYSRNILYYTKWNINIQPNYITSESKLPSFSLDDLGISLPSTGISNTSLGTKSKETNLNKATTKSIYVSEVESNDYKEAVDPYNQFDNFILFTEDFGDVRITFGTNKSFITCKEMKNHPYKASLSTGYAEDKVLTFDLRKDVIIIKTNELLHNAFRYLDLSSNKGNSTYDIDSDKIIKTLVEYVNPEVNKLLFDKNAVFEISRSQAIRFNGFNATIWMRTNDDTSVKFTMNMDGLLYSEKDKTGNRVILDIVKYENKQLTFKYVDKLRKINKTLTLSNIAD